MHSACDDPLRAGFPHSDILGSLLASNSPRLFAGSRVLHRLSTPRHPPCALSRLITPTGRRPITVHKPTRRDTLHGASRRRFNRLKTLSFASVAVAALSRACLVAVDAERPRAVRANSSGPAERRPRRSIHIRLSKSRGRPVYEPRPAGTRSEDCRSSTTPPRSEVEGQV